jgi:aminoglycoside phosphotransferase (APT) family kinase protein
MEFRPVDRGTQAFQQSLTREQIQAICSRVFDADAVSAVELGAGMYNSTYRLSVAGQDRPVILRAAPAPDRQFCSERELMRNEYASVPWLSQIAPLMPRVIAADWSHEIVDRDYLVQTLLDGTPAPERLGGYPRATWPGFYRQLGDIARRVHAVRGPQFGAVNGPAHTTWGEAITASLLDIAADLEGVGLDGTDVRAAAAGAAGPYRNVLDEVGVPRLLAGDLWTVNVMLDAAAEVPTITGVFDLDRTWWGDPAADWTIRMAAAKPGTGREAFWDGYGPADRSPAAVLRSHLYEIRHLGAIRLERHRLGKGDAVQDTYKDVAAELAVLSGRSEGSARGSGDGHSVQ